MLISLRSTLPEDIDFVIDAEQHPENKPYIGQWARGQHLAALGDSDFGHFIIERADERKFVGYLILAGLKNPNEHIELLRFVITQKSLGYGRATLRLVKKYVFEDHQAHRLWLDVMEQNQRARILYQSEGFIVEGKLRECFKVDDTFVSLIVMSMLCSEYNNTIFKL